MTSDSAKPIKQADSDRPQPIGIDPAAYEGDIVSRLRHWRGLHLAHSGELFEAAADEIERLRTIMHRIVDEDCTVAIQGGTLYADGEPLFAVERTPPTQPTPGEGSTPGEGTSEPVALGTAHGIADTATVCGPGDAERDTTKPRNGAEHAGSAAATKGRTMTQDNEEPSAASAGSVALRQPFAWAVCNPVGTYYRSFGYHHEALECCLRKTRETGDCFYIRALYPAPPQDAVVRLPPLDPNGAPGWNAAIGAVREALADAGVDWDPE